MTAYGFSLARRSFLAAVVAVVGLPHVPAGAAEPWTTWVGPKFGTTVELPAGLTAEPPPDAGDGRSFRDAAGMTVAVFARFNVMEETLEDIRTNLLSDGDHAVLDEDRMNADSIFLSGSRRVDGRAVVFRERHMLAVDRETIHAVVIACPAAIAATCTPIAERIVGSLRSAPSSGR